MKRGPKEQRGQARDSILAAAKRLFAAKGYDATSMRAIAAEAELDPALIHYYFSSKSELFLATIEIPVRPPDVIRGLLSGDRATLGETTIRTLLAVWDNPASGGPLISVLRSAPSHGELLRDFLETQIRPLLAEAISGPDADLRATAFITQIFGLVFLRYVLVVQPLASAEHEEVVALLGPTLQQYMDS